MNTWILRAELPDLAQDGATELARRAAAALVAESIGPVDSLVLSPAGDVVGGLWVQDVFAWGARPDFLERPAPDYPGRGSARYGHFLTHMLAELAGER